MSKRVIKYSDFSKKVEHDNATSNDQSFFKADHPSTMENGTATALYILTMIIGTLFYDRLLIYIMATVIYFCFRKRETIRRYQWIHKNKKK